MSIFCLNIVVYDDVKIINIDNIFNKLKSKIQKIRIINFSDNNIDDLLVYIKKTAIEYSVFNAVGCKYNDIIKTMTQNDSIDLCNIIVDLDQEIVGNITEILNVSDSRVYYINHIEGVYTYPKLFIFSKNSNIDNPSMIDFSLSDKQLDKKYILLGNVTSKLYNQSREYIQKKYKNICSYISRNHKDYSLVYAFFYYIIKDFDEVITQCKQSGDDKWFKSYMLSVSYFNNNNYKLAIDYANDCLSISKNRLEPLYIISKINYANKSYESAKNALSVLSIKRLEYNRVSFAEIEIYDFFLHCQNILINKALENTNRASDICEYLLNNLSNNSYCNIISQILKTMLQPITLNQLNIQIGDTVKKNITLNDKNITKYTYSCDDFKNSVCVYTYDKTANILSVETGDKTHNLTNITLENFSILRQEDITKILTIDSNILKIMSISSDKNTLVIDKSHNIDSRNLRFVSKFVKVNNIHLALVKTLQNGVYRFMSIDIDSLETITISRAFTFRLGLEAYDIDVCSSGIVIFFKNLQTHAISLENLYFDYNIPIQFTENIKIEIDNDLELGIKTIGYTLTEKRYKNYNIVLNGINAEYDLNRDIVNLKSKSIHLLIKDFVYLPQKIENPEKTATICYYKKQNIDQSMIDILKNYKEGENYIESKYLIIDSDSLENLSNLEVSSIIESKTLIISLINENCLEEDESEKKYTSDEYLNKLFLFNIVKNDSYTNFIHDNILDKNQYDQRKEFMDVDLNNIYNNCNIFNNYFLLCEKANSTINKYEAELNKDEYRKYLLTKCIQNITNINHIEIIRYIIINKQDVEIYHNTQEIPSILELINIFAESYNLNAFESIDDLIPIKCILYCTSLEESTKYRQICDSGSLIYCETEDFIYYT